MDKLPLKKIHLFTNELKIANILNSHFYISKVFTENKTICKKKGKKIFLVKNLKDLNKINIDQKVDLAVSYGFGFIFTKLFIQRYNEGIWNIHPGDLPKYRGRHPITAAFLNDEKKIGISIHRVDEKIDRGYLLSKSFVSRTYKDDEVSIKNKIFSKIPKLMRSAKKNIKNKKILKIGKGKYHKPFFNGIKINDSKKFDYIYIYNAAKAQKFFGGITVNGKKYYDALFYKNNKVNPTNDILVCKNNKKIILINKE